MQKKKEKFLDKIVKKNYNNELELLLETKPFDENTKNILLTILYKIEAAYKDYEHVKRNVMPKDEFLQMIINIIENNVNEIKIVKMNSEEASVLNNKSFFVDKKNKKIICYPIERNLLYALSKICKKDIIIKDKYDVINVTLSDLLNTGNNINTVEPLRDFNGFSWSTVTKEIESIEHNLVYQVLRILVGAKFLNDWIYNKEFIIDYYELFVTKLEETYGKEISDELIDIICKLSVYLDMKYNKEVLVPLFKDKENIERKLNQIRDKKEFTKEVTKRKKDINKQIRKIDETLNDKILLQQEYKKRNEKLPLDRKIFSMKILADAMRRERESLIKKRKLYNEMLTPQKFVKYKNDLENKYEYLKLLENGNHDTLETNIKNELLEFQDKFLECFKIKIQNAKTKEEIKKLLYEFRYYTNLPYGKKQYINDIKELTQKIDEVSHMLILKAVYERELIQISNNEMFDYSIFKNIFNTRIIDLYNIEINIKIENNEVFFQMFDENVFEEKIKICDLNQIDTNGLLIKTNKNIKLFNA